MRLNLDSVAMQPPKEHTRFIGTLDNQKESSAAQGRIKWTARAKPKTKTQEIHANKKQICTTNSK